MHAHVEPASETPSYDTRMGKDKEEKKAKKEKKEEKVESEIKKEKKEKKEKKVKAEAEVPEDDKAAKKAAKKAKKAAEAAAAAAPPPEDEKAAKKAKKAAKRAAEEAAAAEEVPAKKAKKEKKEKKEEEAPAAAAGGDEQVRVYVANLPFSVDDASIQATFAECGTIVSTDWLTHSDTGRFKGATRMSRCAAPPRLATLGLLLSAPGSSRYALHALSSGARAPQIPVGGCGGTARSGPRHGRLPPAPVPRL